LIFAKRQRRDATYGDIVEVPLNISNWSTCDCQQSLEGLIKHFGRSYHP